MTEGEKENAEPGRFGGICCYLGYRDTETKGSPRKQAENKYPNNLKLLIEVCDLFSTLVWSSDSHQRKGSMVSSYFLFSDRKIHYIHRTVFHL